MTARIEVSPVPRPRGQSRPKVKKILLSFVLFVLLAVLLVISLLALADLAVRRQPVRAAPSKEGDLPTEVDWVRVRIDERTFTLFAALNAAGYDHENFGLTYHPVRQLVRQRLAGRSFPGLNRLRWELKFMDTYIFNVWSLHFGGPPDFPRQEANWSVSGNASLFYGLDRDLSNFYKEMDIGSLWQEVRPQYEQEAARYQKAAGAAVREALAYTRLKEAAPVQQVVIIPNLLEAHWRGNGPHIGSTAYVITGPTGDQPDVSLIQHEVLHSMVGSLVEANLNAIDPQRSKELNAALQKRVPAGYGSWEGVVEESVVRALGVRLVGPQLEETALRNDEQAGFSIVRPLAEKLKDYEAGSATLEEFMPELLKTLNSVKF